MPGAVNELNSSKCRKLLQSSKRVVCVELFEGSFGVVLESKLLKVWKRTFNSKTSLKQLFWAKQLFQSCFRLVFESKVQTADL